MVEHFYPEKDLGTPARESETLVTLSIDGVEVTVPEGTSVMRAAALVDINIPKLCASDNLEAFGSCRLCTVEIEGRRGYHASCTTPVGEGMVVRSQTQGLAKLRRNVMELYISDHPLDCLTCPANGDCELQDMAGSVGLREVRYGFAGENHLSLGKDESNPYFTFDASKCIVCSRCVRACAEVQGTFALTLEGRGFDSKVSTGRDNDFLSSDCVSCGACVQACPTATLTEKSVIEQGQPEHSVITTCAYCGVGCSFKAEMKGDQLVRMTPWKGGQANHGHACVKGRFAFGYATHKDRLTKPMIRDAIDQPWREVEWEEAIGFAARRLREVQQQHGTHSVGGITSSRCTNEETYLVQKLVRAALGTNNTDTCARVCHSPTGYGLKMTLGESAGTQDFDSVLQSDCILVIGANPTDAHPVFGSLLRKRLRQGAQLIVADPRHIDLLDTPHTAEPLHLPLRPGANVALVNALAHVIVTEGLEDKEFIAGRCSPEEYAAWREFIADPGHAPEVMSAVIGAPAERIRDAARLYAGAGNGAIYYGLGVTEHSQGSTTVMGIANLAMATGNIGRPGVGVNPLRGQNNVQGSCDMGSFPHELPGYQPVTDAAVRASFEQAWGVELHGEPGLRIPGMFDAAIEGRFKAMYVQGEDIAQSDPNTQHVEAALRSLDLLIVQDIFLNETAKFAHVILPGSTFLEKNGTFTNAERRINRVRKVMPPLAGKEDWQVTQELAQALGYPMHYEHPSEIMAEIASVTPSFAGVSYPRLEELGSIQWPCNDQHPSGMPVMHGDSFPIGLGRMVVTEFMPTSEKVSEAFPLLLTTGRILSQYNVGAQTRRTENNVWHGEDVLEIHPHDAAARGIQDGQPVTIASRTGNTVLRAEHSQRMQPGVVYTTFHFPHSGANVITTDNSDWATNCPEYKVTAVQVSGTSDRALSDWQRRFEAFTEQQLAFAGQGQTVEEH
ncbi:formate dehydrogenase subunit alpha [Oceanimonas baumannii]|uniref:Formate dehydrogenase major subunit n=1 Tax=Oceanimonas baumannii TaxID=129578 RepID=A0A235CKF8_9GAMM|nr:formate dehydrogenase subunit alpha [Oceanimonas baumannii]OYD25022.1 formate dehydrogenase subunit alpha [Oceanimonas baumannii]TDW59797.1 formate dehydrogenase major subunit [Oceanimonas baumannii]